MSCSCSGGTGTPFTDLSLWIWLKVCLCSSRVFKISCKTAALSVRSIRRANAARSAQSRTEARYLVLLQFPVQHVGRLLVSVLKRNLLPQGQLCPVQPGPHHSQGTGKRFVQVDVPVQQLQMMSNFIKGIRRRRRRSKILVKKSLLCWKYPHMLKRWWWT